MRNMNKKEAIEKLAGLAHEQWVFWAKALLADPGLYQIHPHRIDRWRSLFVPYEQLPEEEKETDRIWARRYYKILKEIK